MIDLTGEELMLAERIIGETEYEPEADHDLDFREDCNRAEIEANQVEAQMINHYQEG